MEEVGLDSCLAHEEPLGYIPVGRSRCDELKHLEFALADGFLYGLADLVQKAGGDARVSADWLTWLHP